MQVWKWLYPGIGLKRWMALLAGAILLTFVGVVSLINSLIYPFVEINTEIDLLKFLLSGSPVLGLLFSAGGIALFICSLMRMLGKISSESDSPVLSLYREKRLGRGPQITALGGGTGLSNLLRGLKRETSNINAVVTVSDDGGSSGKLRSELSMPPPGDIRNCLVALADTEPLMEDLFQYRFSADGHLVGHSFGNLFIASMNQVLGDFEDAVRESSKVLAVKGQVLPATKENVRLGAVFEDGSSELGESTIPLIDKKIEKVFLKPESCQASQRTIESLKETDLITVGPGSLYTSLLPNLLIDDIFEIMKNSPATKIYICNIMTQPGETDDYDAADHVRAITEHLGSQIFDWIIVNREPVPEDIARRYREEGSRPVGYKEVELKEMGLKIRSAELLQRQDDYYLRHDPQKLSRIIMSIADENSGGSLL
ncbi:gluconeogenesis factor YvcK family protein [Halarsenatibacter silvermanii]|uniref:Putative gluconeogenesis factor n=1 Tax=Halarsenatibacter silvermanii TaxID=321763 RepID=A0A1G9RQM4_9FIRM|nr:YvcK family protein [Halarsenatibacter silvermanii]SDM25370.1 conserved hypothetical protein, cofD-related [Halarsenatibacter silvermanii]